MAVSVSNSLVDSRALQGQLNAMVCMRCKALRATATNIYSKANPIGHLPSGRQADLLGVIFLVGTGVS